MLSDKRINILCGHYGSGKTNVALNLAYGFKRQFSNVAVADLDIVNPYIRAEDSRKELKDKGIRLICSDYAGSNVDIPAMPQDMYAITDDKSLKTVIDVGGDDRGAYALGRLTPEILSENNYNMLMVINMFRPLTPDAESTIEVMREIEYACGIKFNGIINNSNLGCETTKNDIISSFKYAEEVSKLSNIPVVFTSAWDKLRGEFPKTDNLFFIHLQSKITDSNIL